MSSRHGAIRRSARAIASIGAAYLIMAAPAGARAPELKAAQAIARAQAALKAKQVHPAIEILAIQIGKPTFRSDPAAPALLMMLAETSEVYVQGINDRYWKRSRLDPRSPSWLPYLRKEQRWAAQRYASFQYFDPRGRYRSDGVAYKLLVNRFPRHPLAEEAAWRLIPREDDGEHDLSVDPALIDASRHERFLKQYPRSKYRLAAKLAIGWDYLYASGFTWGAPDRRRFEKGQRILQGIIKEAPQSPEAQKARRFLDKAKNPWH
ncbi:MAG TPA: hypothetical protein V6D00_03895 [Pantanalinema sp.]